MNNIFTVTSGGATGGGGGYLPLILKIFTEFSPILRYAFSHFRVGFLPFWGLLPKVEKVIFSYFGAKVTGKYS
jgi:hypothetical protein